MRLGVAGVSVDIDGARIVDDVSFDVPPGTWLGLLGPNGCGKSTLLRSVYRVLRPTAGAVLLADDDVWRDLDARGSARRTAVMAQDGGPSFAFTVLEVVRAGRLPHQRLLAADSDEDRDVVDRVLDQVGLATMAHRVFATLSGGEKQRVLLARALAQRSRVLVLDEPTNHLDVRAQFELLELVRAAGLTTVAALHDLNLAAAYCDHVCVMAGGVVTDAGPVDEVLTPEVIERVFGVCASIGAHPLTGRRTISLAPATGSHLPARPPRPTTSSRR